MSYLASKWKMLFFLVLVLYVLSAILISILIGIYWDDITDKENSCNSASSQLLPNSPILLGYQNKFEYFQTSEYLKIARKELYTYHMLNVIPYPYCYYFAENVYSVAYSIDQIVSMNKSSMEMKIIITKNLNSHGRLDINGQGIVIGSSSLYAAYQGTPIGYIYQISNLNTEVLELKDADAIGADCFFQKDNDYVAYCCSRSNSGGIIGSNFLRYELDKSFQNIIAYEEVVFVKDVQFISCTQTTAGYLVAGTLGTHSPSTIYIYDPTKEKGSKEVAKLTSENGLHAYQIIEIQDDIILAAQGELFNIFNLQKYSNNPTIPSLSHKLLDNNVYISATQLLLNEEKESKEYTQFAIVGHSENANSYRQGGLVQIYKYYPDENMLSFVKGKSDILNTYQDNNIDKEDKKKCEFISVREMRPGLIYFGGNIYCDLVCTWEYLQAPEPLCYNYPVNTYIVDFIKNCNYQVNRTNN